MSRRSRTPLIPWLWNLEQSEDSQRQGDALLDPSASIQGEKGGDAQASLSAVRREPVQASESLSQPPSRQLLNSQDVQELSMDLLSALPLAARRGLFEEQAEGDHEARYGSDVARTISNATLPDTEPGPEPARQAGAGTPSQDPRPLMCRELAAEPVLSLDSAQATVSATPILDLSLTFLLSSRPTASKTIYLDFNGHTTSGTSWNDATMGSSFYSPAYDTDGNPSVFSDNELANIQAVWQRVAADYSPFDVNVTLQEPPADWLSREGGSDSHWGVRSVITSYGPSSSTAGGIAFIGSFNSGLDTPVYVYQKSVVGVCEAVSHEVGHSLWLAHDGTASSTYYTGHGGTGETSWAPTMGSSYSRNVTSWDDGTYTGTPEKANRMLNPDLAAKRPAGRAKARLTNDQ